MNLLTSKWSPTSSVPSMEGEGILKACKINVVANSASNTVTSKDSRYSDNVVSSRCRWVRGGCAGTSSCAVVVSDIALSLPKSFVQNVRAQCERLVVPLLFWCCPGRWPCTRRRSRPRSRTSSGDPDHFLPQDDTPPETD